MPGFTCCVPGCYSNSHRDRELRFYTFPKDTVQREIWLKNISRAGVSGCFSTFQPTTGHRVCSIHFAGGRKTYSVRVPTLFPLRGVNERKNRRGRKGKVSATIPVITNVVSLTADAESPEVGAERLANAAKVSRNGQNGQAADAAEAAVQGDGSCLPAETRDLRSAAAATTTSSSSSSTSSSSAAVQQAARYTVVDLCTLGALDHPYSLNTGTTAAELLKKLNEQRDIIALLEIKMKEMKSTIRQLKVTEAKLKEEVRERDLMLSGAAVRKKV